MSFEEKLRERARTATDDASIVDVAEMHPRGFAAAAGAGAGAGSLAGDSLTDSSVGSALGGMGGAAAGMAASAAARDLPLRVCVAVSADAIYLLEIGDKVGYDNLQLFATLDRGAADIEIHGRVFNRTVTLTDTSNDHVYELEAPRFGPFKSKDLIRLLEADESVVRADAEDAE
mgnify:CR=1 FL=1